MANYCYVENNEIKELCGELPKNWKNISGLDLSKNDRDFLKSIGWYIVEKEVIYYDIKKQKIIDYEYKFENDNVYEIPKIITYTDNEISEQLENKKYHFYNFLRQQRNNLLKDCDWTQTIDIQSSKTTEWIEKWKKYRQSLRDLPTKYSEDILLSQMNDFENQIKDIEKQIQNESLSNDEIINLEKNKKNIDDNINALFDSSSIIWPNIPE
jgi:hypothetical protein